MMNPPKFALIAEHFPTPDGEMGTILMRTPAGMAVAPIAHLTRATLREATATVVEMFLKRLDLTGTAWGTLIDDRISVWLLLDEEDPLFSALCLAESKAMQGMDDEGIRRICAAAKVLRGLMSEFSGIQVTQTMDAKLVSKDASAEGQAMDDAARQRKAALDDETRAPHLPIDLPPPTPPPTFPEREQ